MDDEQKKKCSSCGFPLPLGAFYACSSTDDGRQDRCKACDDKEGGPRGEPKPAKKIGYAYRGVSGGPLLAGYVREPGKS